jgi:autophagy-related protein 2
MKRVYKFLLKRLLGRLLVNEIDLEQLEVQLGAGTLELRDLLLDTEYLNEQVRSSLLCSKVHHVSNHLFDIEW